MKGFFLLTVFALSHFLSFAQPGEREPAATPGVAQRKAAYFIPGKNIPATQVKDQGKTGTCWSFSTTSLIESQLMKNKLGTIDLSEMFTVRNIYIEKAKNYMLRQGRTQFSEGALGHDVIRAISTYGAVPENVYSGLKPDQARFDHSQMTKDLRSYLDSMLKSPVRPIPSDWLTGYKKILDDHLGVPPSVFKYNGQRYTPVSFAKDAMNFKPGDYVNITSFKHHPYYQPFIVEVPDNFSNGAYYNLPLNEMIDLTKNAINSGYSLMWDADVSNNGFKAKAGLALNFNQSAQISEDDLSADANEERWDESIRQSLFENLVTQDDHLMHITGIGKSKSGKTFFIVKNSWGNVGPHNGYVHVSESYFAINTITLVVPRAALSKTLLDKLKIQ